MYRDRMKRLWTRLILLLVIVTLGYSKAGAEQPRMSAVDANDEVVSGAVYERYYLSTPKRVYAESGMVPRFEADSVTNYPYEIYLPNETRPADYRIHSNYTNDTDACASCHATHTAVGANLLQWFSTYETCMACHDGTVSTTYNVVDGLLPGGNTAGGGMFGNGNEMSLSYHNIFGGITLAATPGGSRDAVTVDGKVVRWDIPFGCESCHSPHGMGGNARILHPDPNGVQTVAKDEGKYDNYRLHDISGDSVIFVAYPISHYNSGNPIFVFSAMPLYMLNTYPYLINIAVDGEPVTTGYVVNNSQGFTRIIFNEPISGTTVTASFTPSLRVRMAIQGYLTNTETVGYLSGTDEFCIACHEDYVSQNYGRYAEAYLHPVSSDRDTFYQRVGEYPEEVTEIKFDEQGRFVCLSCHLAHGVSQIYWERLDMRLTILEEQVGSSALKRMPNSNICLRCHEKDKENQGYTVKSGLRPEPPPGAEKDYWWRQENATYVGYEAARCGDSGCHRDYTRGWSTTPHSKMVQKGHDAISEYASNGTTWLGSGAPSDTVSDVAYVLGYQRRQAYVKRDNDRYVLLDKQFDIKDRRWVPMTEGGENIAGADWEDNCIGCHVTGYDNGTWSDSGISCEACHGPGEHHVKVPSSRNILSPAKVTLRQQTEICGQCHARGSNVEPGYSDARGYVPRAEMKFTNPNDPDYSTNDFYLGKWFNVFTPSSDPLKFFGQSGGVSDAVYNHMQYNEFIQSRHFTTGTMSCITCHSSHKMNGEGKQLKGTAVQICSGCHESIMALDRYMPKRASSLSNDIRNHTFGSRD